MPSTFTVNLGVEKIASGEQSGTWGDTTNVNWDMVDQAIDGIISITLASAGTSGTPNTLAITNGSVSDGRNRFIEFVDGADLGATAYVQLTPNDAEKIVYIRNSLSGARDLILFQGTYNASNDFVVPNGADVVVKFDGGGAGATVTDVYNNLTATAITTTGNATVGGNVAATGTVTGSNLSGTNTGDEPAASDTVAGIVELATIAETNTGTDATRAVTPDGLDGWTGSAQIATVGTITSGTWQGAAISTTYVADLSGVNTGDEPAASDTVSGVIELATQAEVDAGTDTVRAVTPNTLANYTGLGASTLTGLTDTTITTPADGELLEYNTGVWRNRTFAELGLNTANWDTAYNDKINSASFATGTGVLTLTQQDAGTVTVDLDGRYLQSYTETDTLATVTGRGATTSTGITVSSFVKATTFRETAVSIAASNIDCSLGNVFYKTTTTSTTFTFSNVPSTGNGFGITVILTQSGVGNAYTWPAAVKWDGGTAPDAPANGDVAVYTFFTRDGGTTWYGIHAGSDFV